MPLAYHSNRSEMYRQQYRNSEEYILPFIASSISLDEKQVLEIGCAEGGVLKPFADCGCRCVGIDLNGARIEFAKEALSKAVSEKRVTFIVANIHDSDIEAELRNRFDVVILMNTLEHIPSQKKLLMKVRQFLKKQGVVFIAFPPWFMPYGGHQQMADSIMGKMPYYHLLPRPLYRGLLTLFRENRERIEALLDMVDTRLTINGFEKLMKECRYTPLKKQFYLINPIYAFKFGMPALKQLPGIDALPWIRDFITTTCYYLLKPIE